jgi:hypothetical protein
MTSFYKFLKSVVKYRKEPELEPEPQFVISASAPEGNLILALGSGSTTLPSDNISHTTFIGTGNGFHFLARNLNFVVLCD